MHDAPLHNAQCTMHSAQCTMHHCTMHSARCTTAQCTVHNAQCIVHDAPLHTCFGCNACSPAGAWSHKNLVCDHINLETYSLLSRHVVAKIADSMLKLHEYTVSSQDCHCCHSREPNKGPFQLAASGTGKRHSEPGCNCRCSGLAVTGEQADNSAAQQAACSFLVSKQRQDGGWGESYLSSQTKVRHPASCAFEQNLSRFHACAHKPRSAPCACCASRADLSASHARVHCSLC